jgi:hypothetical protein
LRCVVVPTGFDESRVRYLNPDGAIRPRRRAGRVPERLPPLCGLRDFLVVAPDVVWPRPRMKRSYPSDPQTHGIRLLRWHAGSTGRYDFSPCSLNNVQVPGDRPSIGRRAVRAFASFLLAACTVSLPSLGSGQTNYRELGAAARPDFIAAAGKPGAPRATEPTYRFKRPRRRQHLRHLWLSPPRKASHRPPPPYLPNGAVAPVDCARARNCGALSKQQAVIGWLKSRGIEAKPSSSGRNAEQVLRLVKARDSCAVAEPRV